MSNIKKAYYRRIPAYIDLDTNELVGRNGFYNWLIGINLWIDVNLVGIVEFPVYVEEDDKTIK